MPLLLYTKKIVPIVCYLAIPCIASCVVYILIEECIQWRLVLNKESLLILKILRTFDLSSPMC